MLYCGFPSANLRGHATTLTLDHADCKRLTGLQIRQPRATQNLDMHEHVFLTSKSIGKAKPLAFVEPLHTRRFQRRRADHFGINIIKISKARCLDIFGRFDLKNFDGLLTPISLLPLKQNTSAIRDRALTEIAKHIGMKQNVWPTFIRKDKAESLYGIKPFHPSVDSARCWSVFSHRCGPTQSRGLNLIYFQNV